MKKLSFILFPCFLIAGIALSGCTKQSSAGAASSATVDIGFCINDTTNPFLGWLTTSVQKLAADDGINIQIADASSDSTKQLEQIENFIAMKVKVIALFPVDPNNLQDIIKRAQAQGIKVMVQGVDTGVQDFMMNIDQYACGKSIAEIGIEWILKTFTSDGKPESLPSGSAKPKVIVIKATQTIDAKNRSDGIVDGLTEFGKLNVVIAAGETVVMTEAINIMENTWQQNSDAIAVFAYNASAAVGVNEYLMGQVNLDKSKIGVFTGEWSEEFQTLMNASLENKSVTRAAMKIIGPQIDGQLVPLEQATWIFMKDLYEGKMSYGKAVYDSVAKAYPEQETP
jgi:ABC-type sugar transport system substrate-binding protein